MKHTLAMLIITLLLLSACREEKTEVLNNIYLTDADSAISLTVSDVEVNEIFKNIKLKSSDPGKEIIYLVQTFINEEGRVDKINVTDPVTKIPKEFYEQLAEGFGKLRFRPAVLNGNRVKVQTVIALKATDMTGLNTKWSVMLNGHNRYHSGDIQNVTLPGNLKDEDFVISANQMPSPIGGMVAIQNKITYPEIAKRAGIEGRVFIATYLDEKGEVVHTSVIKGLGAGIDETAMNAIKQTKFKPAIQNGIAVKSKITVPIVFKLQ